MNDVTIMKEIKALKDRLFEAEVKLSKYYDMMHSISTSNIDYLAMETGVDLDQDEEEPSDE